MKRKHAFIIILLCLSALLFSSYVIFFKGEKTSIYGTYRPYSEDPQRMIFYKAQNTYLQIDEHHLITYNTFLMGKPLHNYGGAFTLDPKTNTLNIHWLGGKLPKYLKVEKEEENYVIRIGETIYKKEKEKS